MRNLRVFSLLVLLISATGYGASTVYDITSLVSPQMKIELAGKKTIGLESRWAGQVSKVLFEDLYPGANWDHPAIIRVLGPQNNVLQTLQTKRPPVGLEKTPVLSGPRTEANAVKIELKELDGKMRVANPENFYALLINGRANLRHWNDYSFLYRVLVQIYGYRPENIIVLDGVYQETSSDLDGNGKGDINGSSTIESVKKTMEELKAKLKPEHQLLIAVNDHGSQLDGESTIVLMDGEMKVSEFMTLYNELPAGRILSIHEQCFSGGFVRPSVAEERVAMSASTDDEYSWASMDLNFDEFIYYVIAAFAGQNHRGETVNSDANGDGRISAQEAFSFAVARDQRPESPLLESFKNSGNAAAIGLGF